MNYQIMINLIYPPKTCKYREYFKGTKIPINRGYPCDTWGSYLPGDEPHYFCTQSEEIECNEKIKIDINDCCRFTPLKSNIYIDEENGEYYTIRNFRLTMYNEENE